MRRAQRLKTWPWKGSHSPFWSTRGKATSESEGVLVASPKVRRRLPSLRRLRRSQEDEGESSLTYCNGGRGASFVLLQKKALEKPGFWPLLLHRRRFTKSTTKVLLLPSLPLRSSVIVRGRNDSHLNYRHYTTTLTLGRF